MAEDNLGTEWSTGSIPKAPAGARPTTDPASAHTRSEPELTPMDYAEGFGSITRKAPGMDSEVDLVITVAGEVMDE